MFAAANLAAAHVVGVVKHSLVRCFLQAGMLVTACQLTAAAQCLFCCCKISTACGVCHQAHVSAVPPAKCLWQALNSLEWAA